MHARTADHQRRAGRAAPTAGRSTSRSVDRRALATVAKATAADVDRAVQSAQAALESKAWGGIAAGRARPHHVADRAGASRPRRGAGDAREPRQRQAAAPGAHGRAGRGALLRVLRRRRRQDHGAARSRSAPGSSTSRSASRSACRRRSCPWNYPIQIGARGVAPALAAGCAVVLKPSSEAPMTALQLGQIALECGLPPGVLNVVPGTGAEAGVALASHPRHQPAHVHRIGGRRHRGREAGRRQRRARRHGARRQVAEHRLCRRRSRSRGAGRRQRDLSERRARPARPDRGCSSSARRTTRSSSGSPTARATMRVGPGVSDPDMGPIISKRQLETIEQYVAVGQDEGAAVAAGGARPQDAVASARLLLPADAARSRRRRTCASPRKRSSVRSWRSSRSTTWRRRPRWPTAASTGWSPASGRATSTRRWRWRRGSRPGRSTSTPTAPAAASSCPFGGYKKSGYGREKGLESLVSYTQVKNVCIKFG